MARLPIIDIEGYDPLVDPRRRNKPIIVTGQNFLMDADGPVSGFGRTILCENAFANAKGIQSFDVSLLTETVYCTLDGLFKYDSLCREIIPVYVFDTPLTTYFPWTTADVGGKQYFLRRDSPLIEYDPTTDRWTEVSNSTFPADMRAITQSGGRLVVLAIGIVAWSSIDNAADLAPSTSTGAGFQSLSKINATQAEDPYLVLEYSSGFLTYTRQGVMVSELVDALNPFRHDVLSRQHAPLSPWAITQFGDYQHVFISRQGIFSTNGAAPAIFSPLMSEYFHDIEIPRLDLTHPTVIRLHYNATRQWFFIHVADQPASIAYNRAFVMYIPTQKWGLFNRTHRAIVDINVTNGPNVGVHFGYVNTDGDLFRFNDSTTDLLRPFDDGTARIVDFRCAPALPAIETPDETYFTCWMYVTDDEQELFNEAGYYNTWTIIELPTAPLVPATLDQPAEASDIFTCEMQIDCAIGIIETRLAAHYHGPLNAYIEIGVARGGSEIQAIDHLSFIREVTIGALAGSPGDIFEDFLLDYTDEDIFEDWTLIADDTADEDYGEGAGSYSDFELVVRGTLDGKTKWQQQEEIANRTQLDGSFSLWHCYVTGLFHILRINAQEPDQSFHIKTLEADVVQGGLLL